MNVASLFLAFRDKTRTKTLCKGAGDFDSSLHDDFHQAPVNSTPFMNGYKGAWISERTVHPADPAPLRRTP